jgi:hypothetical protein
VHQEDNYSMAEKLAESLCQRFGLTPIELARIISLNEAARLSNLSEDSLKRNHRDKILELGPRRLGMRVGDALMLND